MRRLVLIFHDEFMNGYIIGVYCFINVRFSDQLSGYVDATVLITTFKEAWKSPNRVCCDAIWITHTFSCHFAYSSLLCGFFGVASSEDPPLSFLRSRQPKSLANWSIVCNHAELQFEYDLTRFRTIHMLGNAIIAVLLHAFLVDI